MNELSPLLTKSFASHLGIRGVHFYDETQCEFVEWNKVMGDIRENFPEKFYDKLVDALANYDPDSEFVTVTVGSGQITIELFKAEELQ